ncbi:hypothetical protein LTR56_012677 [Elasticomyces elasticus]|nr:hypothetical protein LTR56_012677 [Elasticomyces elasticus]
MALHQSLSTSRASLLRLPPHLRASAYRHTLARPFSATQTRKTTLIDAAVAGPTLLLNSLHSLGLPWYAVLPGAAVLVRGVLVYYFAALPAQKAAQVRSNLIPLASANSLFQQQSHIEFREKLTAIWMKRFHFAFMKWWVTRNELNKLSKMFNVQSRWWRGPLNFGMLIAFTEAIRMKCSAKEGLLPLLLRPFEFVASVLRGLSSSNASDASVKPILPTLSRDEMLAQRMEQAAITDEHGAVTYDFSKVGPPPAAEAIPSEYLDPSLQTEGLNWCVDLTASDPTLALPELLWLSISANIIFRRTVGGPKKSPVTLSSSGNPPTEPAYLKPDYLPPGVDPEAANVLAAPAYGSKKTNKAFLRFLPPVTNLQRIGLVFAMAMGAAAIKMPAAILLYFIPSLAVGWLQRRWLDMHYPIRPAIQPCKRPLRLRVKKEWND